MKIDLMSLRKGYEEQEGKINKKRSKILKLSD